MKRGKKAKIKWLWEEHDRGEKRSTEEIMTAQRIHCLISLKAKKKEKHQVKLLSVSFQTQLKHRVASL